MRSSSRAPSCGHIIQQWLAEPRAAQRILDRTTARRGYRGSRYSFGYAACPDLEDQAKLFQLIDPRAIDVELTDEFMLHPEQSTSAIVIHHPEAKYFNAR